jgi:hypothetical protein
VVEKNPSKSVKAGAVNAGAFPVVMLLGPGIDADDDPRIRAVTSEATAVVAALVVCGLEQTGD